LYVTYTGEDKFMFILRQNFIFSFLCLRSQSLELKEVVSVTFVSNVKVINCVNGT